MAASAMRNARDAGGDLRALKVKLEGGNTRRFASPTAPCMPVTASLARRWSYPGRKSVARATCGSMALSNPRVSSNAVQNWFGRWVQASSRM